MDDAHSSLSLLVECGGGTICVCGPRGVGKTTAVMRCLAQREVLYGAMVSYVSASTLGSASGAQSVVVAASTSQALSTSNSGQAAVVTECLSLFALGLAKGQFIMASKPSPHLAGAAVIHALKLHPPQRAINEAGSSSAALPATEAHLVVDNAGILGQAVLSSIVAWSASLGLPKLYLWLVSTTPLRIEECWRYKFMTRPDAMLVGQWLEAHATQPLGSDTSDAHATESDAAARVAVSLAAKAAGHYLSHNPMQSSIVARDIRTLMKAVFQLKDELGLTDALSDLQKAGHKRGRGDEGLPPLLRSSADDTVKLARKEPNALVYSLAWSRLNTTAADEEEHNPTEATLPAHVATLGPSAQLLCLALFYCGTVSSSRDSDVFKHMNESRGPDRLRRSGAAKDTVLSSATHAISGPRLWAVYSRLPRMMSADSEAGSAVAALGVGAHIGLCLEPSLVLHHLRSLALWGVLSTGHTGLHTCHLSLVDAQLIGEAVGIDILMLVPTKR